MDRLRQDDLSRARATPPEQKLRDALDTMDAGIRLKRVQLRTRFPGDSEEEIERRLAAWLARDE